jgi:hypothetical protein
MTQYAVPDSTAVATSVTIVGAATVHEATDDGIDSGTPDDNASRVTGTSTASVFIVNLEDIEDPGTANTNHVLKTRATSRGSLGSFHQMRVQLRQGTTNITNDLVTLTGSWVTYTRALTGPEANSITDYTDLKVRVKVAFASGVNAAYTAVEFQCDDQGATTGAVTFTVTPTATIAARGAMTGAASFSVTPSSTLTYGAKFTGATDLTVTPSASLSANASVVGATDLTITPSAALNANASVVGATDLTITPNAVLSANAGVVGTTDLNISSTSNFTGLANLTANTALALTPSGLIAARAGLSGSASVTLTLDGTFSGIASLSGSLSFVITPSAALSALAAIVGVTGLSIGATGTISVTTAGGAMVGSATFEISADGTLSFTSALGCYEDLYRTCRAAILAVVGSQVYVGENAPADQAEIFITIDVHTALQVTQARHIKTGFANLVVRTPIEQGDQEALDLAEQVGAALANTTMGSTRFDHAMLFNDGQKDDRNVRRIAVPYRYHSVV